LGFETKWLFLGVLGFKQTYRLDCRG